VERPTTVRLLTIGGAALVILGLSVIPWGRARFGESASPGDIRRLFTDDFPSPDFNASVQIAYHEWGFWVFIALCVLACFLVNGPVPAMAAAAVGIVVCAAWHQAGIGTVTNLTFGAFVPEIGAALVVVGLGMGISDVLDRRS
jgi:hypothetical protein